MWRGGGRREASAEVAYWGIFSWLRLQKVGEGMLMLARSSDLKLTWAFGVWYLCTKQREYRPQSHGGIYHIR